MRRTARKSERQPTIALINIVFLMLIFFLVAGTVARPLDPELTLVRTADLEGAAPADALVIHADGRMTWQGQEIAEAADAVPLLPPDMPARLVPDRALPAATLVQIGRALRTGGAERIVIVTERGMR